MKKPLEKIHVQPPLAIAPEKPEEASNEITEELRPLEDVAFGFKPLYDERARMKAALCPSREVLVSPPDPFRFTQGVPLLTIEHLVDLADSWEQASGPLIQAMEDGFVKIRDDLQKLQRALKDDRLHKRAWVSALFHGQNDILDSAASSLGIEARTFKFVLGQLVKPCIEKRARTFKPLLQNLKWTRGYCPLCGTLPELGLIGENPGERHLLCALCGHQWSFPRTACAYCGGDDQEERELYYIEGREHQWAELCHECGRYLVCVDMSRRSGGTAFETASAGIVHLDIVAQQRGFLPVAVCPWNVVVREDIVSESKLRPDTKMKRLQLH